MGSFLAFLPKTSDPAGSRALHAARAWLDRGGHFMGEAGRTARALKWGSRLAGHGMPLADGTNGWLVGAGTWTHPSADAAGDLLQLLDERGTEALDELDGCYALCWFDRRRCRLVAQPDHLGRLHLYRATTPAGVLVSTSPIALARASSAEPDPVAVAEFLASGTVYEDRTPFRAVRRLLGGHRYLFAEDGAEHEEKPGGLREQGDVLEACVGAVSGLLRTSKKPLADLTGGLDSRLVVGILRRTHIEFETTVTGEASSPDVKCAVSLARRLGIPIHHETGADVRAARRSFSAVAAAAELAEGMVDAIEYAGIAAVHRAHAARFDASVNGSGGEVYRNYWWGKTHIDGDPRRGLNLALPRFTGSCLDLPFLEFSPEEHFRGVIGRTLIGREGDPLPDQLDHVYLHLRMQCWQGSIASATSRLWPNHSPLLSRTALAALYALDARRRLGARLIREMLAVSGPDLALHPLETGFPVLAPTPGNFWRFLPGLLRQPKVVWNRLQSRAARLRGSDPDSGAGLRALMEDGAADCLREREMALLPVLDRRRAAPYLDRMRAGKAPPAIAGRLLALEFALRAGAGMCEAPRET